MDEVFETSFKPGDQIAIIGQLYGLTDSEVKWLRTLDGSKFREALAKLERLSPADARELGSLSGDEFESKLSELLSRPFRP